MTQPSSIDSKTPFVSRAREYVEKGWGVMPLPEKEKHPPPTGFTGRVGKFADEDDLINWLSNPAHEKANIAIRVGNMLVVEGIRYEVIGIDVDAYKDKKGAKELAALEGKLGPLPDSWIVTSRSDGISGIRFYLVPYGFAFRERASESIEIVQRVHRYAVTFPSVHPDTGGQYWWYAPGNSPDGQNISTEIPEAAKLPVLPDDWLNYLTDNKRIDSDGYGIDLDISQDGLNKWIADNFNPGEQCPRMKTLVAQHISDIEEATTHHDKIRKAHWNLICEAAEGHSGVAEAIKEVEAVYTKVVLGQGKRALGVVQKEILRSRWGAFRKYKAKAEVLLSKNVLPFSPETCLEEGELGLNNTDSGGGKSWIYDIPMKEREFDPKDYDKNDVGQANQLVDRVGDSIRWVEDYKAWVVYDETTWHIDTSKLMQDLFHRACVEPSQRRAKGLYKKAAAHLDNGGTKTDVQYLSLIKDAKKLDWVAEHYGNLPRIKAALERAQSIPGVAIKYDQLNCETSILAMPNGKVLRLDEPAGKALPDASGFAVIDNEKEFYTTMMTAVEYVVLEELSQRERQLWGGYLNIFLPDLEYRRFVQKALGYILIGGNPEKLAIFLVGIRNTGKTTMINAIQSALGNYGETFQPNAIFRDSNTGNNPELGNLLHKRGIFSSESGSQRIYANPFKRNTGGDKISVTRKYANDQIVGIPHFVPVVATNQAPTIDDADEATIKRIMVLPFDIQVSEDTNDKRADVTIPRDAKRAVFTWLVLGYQKYIREGLDYSTWHPKVQAATSSFATELSDVSTFLNEICTVASDEIKTGLSKVPGSLQTIETHNEWSRVTCSALYQFYLADATEGGQKPLSTRAFGKKVREVFGVEVIQKWENGKNSKVYLGLKYKNDDIMSKVKW